MTFKVGDRVRRREEFLEDKWWKNICGSNPALIKASFVVREVSGEVLWLCGISAGTHLPKFELVNTHITKPLSDYS